MKPLLFLLLNLCLSFSIWGQKQETYLVEECLHNNYTENSCDKVFCQPWQKCIDGSCLCKIPYQCPRNGISVCSTNKRTFQNYCQLKSYECLHKSATFMSRGNCNPQGNFAISLDPRTTTTEGILQVELNNLEKIFVCGNGLSMNEANVACRHLGFPQGADGKESIEPDGVSHSPECLKATCRGTETSLAECTLTRLNQIGGKLAKLMCHGNHRECSSGEFRCVNEKCINSDKTCNGINDCGDLSDELCCKACKEKSFHCNSDVCIPNKYLCNNEMDCLTGEDEHHRLCNKTAKEPITEVTGHAEESMDKERKKMKTLLRPLQCGVIPMVTRKKRRLEGYAAAKDEYPWHVAIFNEHRRLVCSGVYIGGCWVLTAAQCVDPHNIQNYQIWTGMINSLKPSYDTETFRCNRVIIHENYNSQTYENDIALVEMKSKSRGSSCSVFNLVPVCIPWSQYMFRSGQQCKVTSYSGFQNVFVLQWVYADLMRNCSEIYKERYLTGMECAGIPDGSVDACADVLGGPLVCYDSNNVGYVWGIASWGENCDRKGHPGVYTEVAHYFEWIALHIGSSIISQYNI
ncbi:complement factor I-like [Candoia aspera]|uniref:complement factor I-like n=1 Tax=Candoia aspera TaxID=51853 RepID=UPI002FD807CA